MSEANVVEKSASPWRRMFQSTAVYALALVGQRMGSMATLILYTRFLTPRDFGILDILDNFTSLLSVIIGSNFPSALYFLYAQQKTDEDRRLALGTSVAGSMLLGLVALGVGLLLAPWCEVWLFGKPTGSPYVVVAFAGLGFGLLLEALFTWLRIIDNTWVYMVASVARTAVGIVLAVVLLAVFGLKIEGALWSNLIGGLLCTVGLLGLFFRQTGWHFSRRLFVDMLWITIPVTLGSLSQFMIHFGDRLFLKEYSGLESLATYSIAYKMAMLLSVAYSSFHTYWCAQITAIHQREDHKDFVSRLFTYLMALLTGISLCLIVLSKPFLLTVTTKSYFGAVVFIPALVLAYYIRSIADFFRIFFILMGKPKADSIINVVAAGVCLGGYVLLIPKYGPWGAILSTGLAFLVMLVMTFVWVRHEGSFPLEKGRLSRIAVAGGASLWAYFSLGTPGNWVLWGASLGILAIYPLLLSVTGFFSENEKAWLQTRWKGLAGKLPLIR